MREGKNREVKNVLGHLGLKVNRLIRVAFGPFQLGELAPGAIVEVTTRALREALGERLASLAGADFSGPVEARDTPSRPGPLRAPRGRDEDKRKGRRGEGERKDRPERRDKRRGRHGRRDTRGERR
jgi:23S rRNA pseudouridine2605 synthase